MGCCCLSHDAPLLHPSTGPSVKLRPRKERIPAPRKTPHPLQELTKKTLPVEPAKLVPPWTESGVVPTVVGFRMVAPHGLVMFHRRDFMLQTDLAYVRGVSNRAIQERMYRYLEEHEDQCFSPADVQAFLAMGLTMGEVEECLSCQLYRLLYWERFVFRYLRFSTSARLDLSELSLLWTHQDTQEAPTSLSPPHYILDDEKNVVLPL